MENKKRTLDIRIQLPLCDDAWDTLELMNQLTGKSQEEIVKNMLEESINSALVAGRKGIEEQLKMRNMIIEKVPLKGFRHRH